MVVNSVEMRAVRVELTPSERKQFDYIKKHYGFTDQSQVVRSLIKKEMLHIIKKERASAT